VTRRHEPVPRTTLAETAYTVAGGALGLVAEVLGGVMPGSDLARRLGRGEPIPSDARPLWFHAASVGELSTLRPLVAEIRGRFPGIAWGVTTTTTTGERAAAGQCLDASFRRLLPLDVWPAADRFVESTHPGAALFVETELWPRLILALARRKVPVCLASARLTEASVRRYRRFGALFRNVVRAFALIATRSAEDRERFLELGADPARTVVLGNTKLDDVPEEEPRHETTDRLNRWLGQRSLVVWGSLRPGEETVAVPTMKALGREANVAWVLAPRHPSEFDATAAIVLEAGLSLTRWSTGDQGSSRSTDVMLLDTLGELRAFYARAEVAIVGGSFCEYGGHNLMEPAGFGVPVVFGPDTAEWPEDTARLIATGGGRRAGGHEDLARFLGLILTDSGRRNSMGASARDAAAQGRGASVRVLEALQAIGFFDQVSRRPKGPLPHRSR
jgi:3-deoxy-D-manno-octulosonic-acid transferase